MKNDENEELKTAEVNTYSVDCGYQRAKCVENCIGGGCWLTCDY